LKIEKIHHVAIIASDYQKSKQFYTDVLGCKIENEVYREESESYKLDLSLQGTYCIELFSFPKTPARLSRPEAAGLRHIAFAVRDLDSSVEFLRSKQAKTEDIRVDEYTQKRFTFLFDPDELPIELYEL
jgi:glyoxylase I family protein